MRNRPSGLPLIVITLSLIISGCDSGSGLFASASPMSKDEAIAAVREIGANRDADACWDYIYTANLETRRLANATQGIAEEREWRTANVDDPAVRMDIIRGLEGRMNSETRQRARAMNTAFEIVRQTCPSLHQKWEAMVPRLENFPRTQEAARVCATALVGILEYLGKKGQTAPWLPVSQPFSMCPENFFQAAEGERLLARGTDSNPPAAPADPFTPAPIVVHTQEVLNAPEGSRPTQAGPIDEPMPTPTPSTAPTRAPNPIQPQTPTSDPRAIAECARLTTRLSDGESKLRRMSMDAQVRNINGLSYGRSGPIIAEALSIIRSYQTRVRGLPAEQCVVVAREGIDRVNSVLVPLAATGETPR